ncbi:hypothetical protein ACFQ0M_29000 [Kitasatospora aburaviensis]
MSVKVTYEQERPGRGAVLDCHVGDGDDSGDLIRLVLDQEEAEPFQIGQDVDQVVGVADRVSIDDGIGKGAATSA